MPKKKQKSLPNNVSEEEFLKVLDKISKKLTSKFKFGYHSVEDMKQQAAIFALEALEKYDNSRPLENFLWTHVRNRLFNFKRDNYQRPGIPCSSCPFYDPDNKYSINSCSKYTDKNECSLYYNWLTRNNIKKNIMAPSTIEDTNIFMDNNIENLTNKQILNVIDEKIPSECRELYLKYRYGEKITSLEKNKIINIIKNLLNIND